jgi:anti-anti-sigma factor
VEILEQTSGAVKVLRPRGPLVQGDADQFRHRARNVIGSSLGRFVLDASGVPYVDSRGLEALSDLTESLAQTGMSLKLCGTTETVREALELTDLSSLIEHYEDVPTAVRSFL